VTSEQQRGSLNNTPLFEIIFQRIAKNNGDSPWIPFSEFMELALYHPDYGYYSRPQSRKIGRDGDFFTSVSVGDIFGMLLGCKIEQEWRENFSAMKGDFVVVEQGSYDGRLACDILDSFAEQKSPLTTQVQYRIVEPRPDVRERLKEALLHTPPRLRGLGQRLNPVGSLNEARAESGIFLCNELLDAFPVRRLIFQSGQWQEHCVGLNAAEDGFEWRVTPLPEMLREFVEDIEQTQQKGDVFPDGYTTEICPAMREWIRDCACLFQHGRWWFIDYGHESSDYFSPYRSEGTLQCYRDHKTHDDPFSCIGETDITAHVNLTHLIRWAEEAGLKLEQLTDQHHFLTHAAKPWLLKLEADGAIADQKTASRLRQFQTLTHPSMMGQKFKVLEFSRG